MGKGINAAKNFLILLACIIIASLLFVVSSSMFYNIFIKSKPDYLDKTLGAFMGAFFAFLFVGIGEIIKRWYDRKVRHYNALVRFEYLCNEYFNTISDNVWVIDDFTKAWAECVQKGAVMNYINRLHTLSVDKEILIDLNNIDFINEVFTFNVDLAKINSSANTLNVSYEDIMATFIQGKIPLEVYKVNMQRYMESLAQLKEFLISLEQKTKRIIAITRILSKDKPPLLRLTSPIFSSPLFTKKFDKKIGAEIKKLESEQAMVSQKSQQEIERILNRVQQK